MILIMMTHLRFHYYYKVLNCVCIILLLSIKVVNSFLPNVPFIDKDISSTAHYLENNDNNMCNNYYDDFYNCNGKYVPNNNNEALADGLLKRVKEMRTDVIDHEMEYHYPNANISPCEVLRIILNALRDSDEPYPNSGYKTLLRFCTPAWKKLVLQSIGAPTSENDENMIITTALGDAISRPNNQYGILVNEEEGSSDYDIYFPSDIVDYDDGRCWLECHILNPIDNSLMIILGWDLERRKEDYAWLVNGLDWQDFRDAYRPGIGREEWTRVYG